MGTSTLKVKVRHVNRDSCFHDRAEPAPADDPRVQWHSMSSRPRRSIPRVNYKSLVYSKLPRAQLQEPSSSSQADDLDRLYRVNIIDEEEDQVKIHYIGFSRKYDEWRPKSEVTSLNQEPESGPVYQPIDIAGPEYSHYAELKARIKASLKSSRKDSPVVTIDIPFDPLAFNGSIRLCGTFVWTFRGTDRYTIKTYRDLDGYLGSSWYIRVLNPNGDFSYIVRETVEFYLYKRKPIQDFTLSSDGSFVPTLIEQNCALVFSFVIEDGVRRQYPIVIGSHWSSICMQTMTELMITWLFIEFHW